MFCLATFFFVRFKTGRLLSRVAVANSVIGRILLTQKIMIIKTWLVKSIGELLILQNFARNDPFEVM